MKPCRIPLLIAFLTIFSGCDHENSDEAALLIFTKDFDFNEDHHDWSPGFADYPTNPEDSSQFELKYAYTEPIESKLTKRSVMLSGKNVNKDLFMYIKKKIDGLEPDTEYTLTFNVELASDLNAIAPSSGGSVYLKAGATEAEPLSVAEGNIYIMNIDKGNEYSAGEDMISLGDIFATGSTSGYALVTRNNTMANSRYVATTNSAGELWLIIGTDSTLEGPAKIFYTRVSVVFSAS